MRGTGSLWLDGETQLLASVKYELHSEQRPGGVLPRMRGRIVIDQSTGMDLIMNRIPPGPNHFLVLRLDDGRRWQCILKSSDGTLLGNGGKGIEDAPPSSGPTGKPAR